MKVSGRQVFLSFLGTSKYVECQYCYQGQCSDVVSFVQEALVDLFVDPNQNSQVYVFLTEQARRQNWENHGNFDKGLKSRLHKKNGIKVTEVDIPEGRTEEEIWEVFNLVFSQLQDGDEVILDITHAFRSIPMLGIVLLNYARFLKNIKIKGIYYGAFEVLGKPMDVKKIEPNERKAPVFDLTGFDALLQWSNGADHFVNYGNTSKIVALIRQELPSLSKKAKEDQNVRSLRDQLSRLRDSLDDLSKIMATNRGTDIYEGEIFNKIRETIENLNVLPQTKEFVYLPALNPLLEKVKDKVTGFQENDVKNGFRAVGWAIQHGLIQQGITMMQEAMITYLLSKLNKNWDDKELRNEISSALSDDPSKKFSEDIMRVKKEIEVIEHIDGLKRIYNSLRDFRNDMNHGGYLKDQGRSPESLKDQLEKQYNELKNIVEL